MRVVFAILALSAASLLALPAGATERGRRPKPAPEKISIDPRMAQMAQMGEQAARVAIAQGKDQILYSVGGGPPSPLEVEPLRLRAEIPVQVMKRHGIEAIRKESGCDMRAARWQGAYALAFEAVMEPHLKKKRGDNYREAIDQEIAVQLAKALAALPKQQ